MGKVHFCPVALLGEYYAELGKRCAAGVLSTEVRENARREVTSFLHFVMEKLGIEETGNELRSRGDRSSFPGDVLEREICERVAEFSRSFLSECAGVYSVNTMRTLCYQQRTFLRWLKESKRIDLGDDEISSLTSLAIVASNKESKRSSRVELRESAAGITSASGRLAVEERTSGQVHASVFWQGIDRALTALLRGSAVDLNAGTLFLLKAEDYEEDHGRLRLHSLEGSEELVILTDEETSALHDLLLQYERSGLWSAGQSGAGLRPLFLRPGGGALSETDCASRFEGGDVFLKLRDQAFTMMVRAGGLSVLEAAALCRENLGSDLRSLVFRGESGVNQRRDLPPDVWKAQRQYMEVVRINRDLWNRWEIMPRTSAFYFAEDGGFLFGE